MSLKKLERYLRVNLSGPGPRLTKKRIYRAAVSQRLRNTALGELAKLRKAYISFVMSVCLCRTEPLGSHLTVCREI